MTGVKCSGDCVEVVDVGREDMVIVLACEGCGGGYIEDKDIW